MFWKALVATFFVVGVFADKYELSDEKKAKVKEELKKMCDRVNAPENAADEITTSLQAFTTCLSEIVNVEELKKEIEDAKPHGALDEVFKKYCAKTPAIKACIHTMIDAFVPCLDTTTKEHIPSAKNGTDQLIDFVCYKDGDRIALFISEKGPECIASKVEPIRACSTKAQAGVSTIKAAQEMTLAEKCAKVDEASRCVVAALESCETPTPANMAESLIKFVRKSSPCHTALPIN